jgi:hypothetical protein
MMMAPEVAELRARLSLSHSRLAACFDRLRDATRQRDAALADVASLDAQLAAARLQHSVAEGRWVSEVGAKLTTPPPPLPLPSLAARPPPLA